GVDERLIKARRMEEVSLGDFVLSGGEIAALALLDACVRLLSGVMGKEASAAEESFADSLLEYPQYTRPPVFEGEPIPEVLTSGDHNKIRAWRRAQAERLTAERRPDLWETHKARKFAKNRPEPKGQPGVASGKLCNTSSPTHSDQIRTARRLLALPTENSRWISSNSSKESRSRSSRPARTFPIFSRATPFS